MLELRGYQQRTLEELDSYLGLMRQHGAKAAFYLRTDRQYREVVQLPGLPYVCLRIPTGGGKTLMACHALGIAARGLLQADRAVCLWLVPSNTIRDQTLAALRDREHPYRQAVDAAFAGQVEVMDLAEALYVQRSTLDGATAIIVSTLAALRVEDTDGRKVYEPAGALSHHFTALAPELEATLRETKRVSSPTRWPMCSAYAAPWSSWTKRIGLALNCLSTRSPAFGHLVSSSLPPHLRPSMIRATAGSPAMFSITSQQPS